MTDAAKIDGIFKLTLPVVMAFPVLFEPKPYMENGKAVGEPKYSANFHFPSDSEELKAFMALSAKLARAHWPDRQFFVTTTDGVKIRQVTFPWRDGNTTADEKKAKNKDAEHLRGKHVIVAKSKNPPVLSYIEKGKLVECDNDTIRLASKNKFYNGVEVLAEFNLVAFNPKGADSLPGITAYLNKVLSTNKGTKLSGGTSSAESFKSYLGAISAEDPTGAAAPGVGEDISDLM